MTNKLVVIINSLKEPKIKKTLLYEMKFLVPNYSCLQNPWLGGYGPQIPVLSVLNWICWTPPQKNSWVRHWCLQTDTPAVSACILIDVPADSECFLLLHRLVGWFCHMLLLILVAVHVGKCSERNCCISLTFQQLFKVVLQPECILTRSAVDLIQCWD